MKTNEDISEGVLLFSQKDACASLYSSFKAEKGQRFRMCTNLLVVKVDK
jgi:hypothetical protein